MLHQVLFATHGIFVGVHRLSNCGPGRRSGPTACEILVHQAGIKPASAALEGRFLTTGRSGKSQQADSLLLSHQGSPYPQAFHQNAIQPEFKIFILLRIVSAKLFCLEDWFCHPPPISCTREGGHSPRFPKTFSAPPQFPSFKASPPLRIQCPSSILLTLSFTVVHQRSSLFHWNFEIESYRLCPLFELLYPCLENSMDIGAWQLQSVGLWRVGHDWACTLMLHL